MFKVNHLELIHHYPIFIQKPQHIGIRKHRAPEAVDIRIYSITRTRTKVAGLQHTVHKHRPRHITMIKYRRGQVTFAKVGLMESASDKTGITQLFPAKTAVVQQTAFKHKGQTKVFTNVKRHTQHLSIPKGDITPCSIVHNDHTEVTPDKSTVLKNISRQIDFGHQTRDKGTGYVFALWYRMGDKIPVFIPLVFCVYHDGFPFSR